MRYRATAEGKVPFEPEELEAFEAEVSKNISSGVGGKNISVRSEARPSHLRADMEAKLTSGDLAGAIRLLDQIYQAELP